MPGKKIYDESKQRFSMTLTKTAIAWLEEQRQVLGANSASDVIEKMARRRKNNR